MSEIRSTDEHGQLIVAHDTRATVWDAETTADTADTVPGRVVPSVGSLVRLVASGDQEGADTIELQTLRAGAAGTRFEVGWKKSTDTHVYGYDQPTIPTHTESVYFTTETGTAYLIQNPRAVVLDDQRILMTVAQYAPAYTGSTPPNYFYTVRSTAGVWSSPTAVYGGSGGDVPTFPGCEALSAAPLVRRDAAGTVLVYTVTHTQLQGVNVMQVAVVRSVQNDLDFTEDPAGLTAANTECLPAGIETAANDAIQLSVAEHAGQVCLVLQHENTVHQYASNDGGYTFTLIGSIGSVNLLSSDLLVVQGSFVLATGEGTGSAAPVKVRRIGSATDSFADVTAVQVADLDGGSCGPVRLVTSDDGHLWLYAHNAHNSRYVYAYYSSDGGSADSWQQIVTLSGVDEGARVVYGTEFDQQQTATAGDVPWCVCWHRGRVALVARRLGATGAINSYLMTYLGGSADLVMPYRGETRNRLQRVSWGSAWLPVGDPADTFTETGTVTKTPNNEGGTTLSTASGVTGRYDVTGTLSVTSGSAGLGVSSQVTAGTVYYELRCTFGGSEYLMQIAHDTTNLTVWNGAIGTGVSMGTVATTAHLDIVAMIVGGAGVVYYRTSGDEDGRAWLRLGGGALNTVTGTATPQRAFVELQASTTVKVRWLGMSVYTTLAERPHTILGVGITPGGGTTREKPIGLPVGPLPQYITDAVYLAGSAGPAHLGDAWSVSPTSPYAVARAACDYVYPSPRTRWRSSTTTDGMIVAYRFGTENSSRISATWAVYIEGNAPSVAFAWHNGTSWESDITLTRHIEIAGIREGQIVYCTNSAATLVQYVDRDELVGGYVDMGSGDVRRIVANTAGAITLPTAQNGTVARIQVEGIDGTEGVSGTWRIVFPRSVHLLPDTQAAKRGYRLKLQTTSGGGNAPPEGYFEQAHLVGPAWPVPWQHGKDTVRVHRPRAITAEAADGTRRTHKLGPAEETVELHWEAAPRNMHDWYIDAATADWFGVGTSGDQDAAEGETMSTMRALVERHASSGAPVLYVAQYDRDTNGAGTAEHILRHRCMGSVVGTIEGEWRTQHAGHGDEQYTEVIRGGTVRIKSL